MILGEENKELRLLLRKSLKVFFVRDLGYPENFILEILSSLEDFLLPTLLYNYYSTHSNNFKQYLCDLDIKDFLGKYISLRERLDTFLNNGLSDFNSVAELTKSNEIKILGDIHPGGVTKFSDGKAVYYRGFPDYSSLFEMLEELFPLINNYFPKILKHGDWFEREYIDIVKNGSLEDIKGYYWNLGYIMPLILLFRTFDSNQENILINLPFPKFFDFECIFMGSTLTPYSISSSGLIKTNEQDRSAITGGLTPIKSLLKPMIFGDEMNPRIEWIVTSKGRYHNLPQVNSKEVSPRDFIMQMREGWVSGSNDIQKNLKRIKDIVNGIDVRFRVILKPTKVYRYIIIKSLYPQEYLGESSNEAIKRDLLKYTNVISLEDICVNEYESEILNMCQIPVFYSSLHSKDIINPRGRVVGRHVNTPFEKWIEYIDNFDEKFLETQFGLLKQSLI